MSTKFENHFDAAQQRIERAASELVRQTALDVEAAIKADMASPKHGREYGGHIASAPGEAPAIDTGLLAGSIQATMDGAYAAEVGSPQEIAPLLEQGTAEIAARPAFENAAEKARNTFQKNAQKLR